MRHCQQARKTDGWSLGLLIFSSSPGKSWACLPCAQLHSTLLTSLLTSWRGSHPHPLHPIPSNLLLGSLVSSGGERPEIHAGGGNRQNYMQEDHAPQSGQLWLPNQPCLEEGKAEEPVYWVWSSPSPSSPFRTVVPSWVPHLHTSFPRCSLPTTNMGQQGQAHPQGTQGWKAVLSHPSHDLYHLTFTSGGIFAEKYSEFGIRRL